MDEASMQCPYCAAPFHPSPPLAERDVVDVCHACLNPVIVRPAPNDEPRRIEGFQDIRMAAPPGSVMAGLLGELPSALERLPELPEIPQRVLAMIHDPIVTMSDLAKVITEDPVISVRVQRLANSAWFAAVDEVRELSAACARVGMRNLANIVHAVRAENVYRSKDRQFVDLMHRLLLHSVGTAHCADALAEALGLDRRDLPFAAGLTHDIGRAVLLDIVSVRYTGSTGRLKESKDLLSKVLDRFHHLVGLHVAVYWEMPVEVRSTTLYHDNIDRMPFEPDLMLAHLVRLSSDMARAAGFAPTPAEYAAQEPAALANHPSSAHVGVDGEVVGSIARDLPERLDTLMNAVMYS